MGQTKLSKLQKWILSRASEGPDKIGLGDAPGLLMARVINEFYGVPVKRRWWLNDERVMKLGGQNFSTDVNSQRASVSRTFVSLFNRELVDIFQGRAWTGITLTEQGKETVKSRENFP